MIGLQTASTSFCFSWNSSWSSSSCTWHSPSWHTSHVWHTCTSCTLVQLGDDWVADGLNLLLLLLELLDLSQLVGIKPLDGIITLVGDLLLVVLGDFVSHLLILDGGLHVEAVALQTVLGRDSVLLLVIFLLELLSIIDHAFNFFLGQTTLVVGDGDLVLLASALVTGRHIQDTVGVNVKSDLNLGNSSWSWRNTSEVKLAEEMVVLGHGSLSLIDLDGDSRLVVRVGGEGLGLLGGDGGVPLDQGCHHSSSGLNSERKWSNIKKQKI